MGPVDLIISRNSYAGGIRGEESGAGIEASIPCPIRTPQSAPLRALPQISHPGKSANDRSVCQARDFLRSVARKSAKSKRSLDEGKEWIESTEEKLLTINKEIFWFKTTHGQYAKVNRKQHQLLHHSNLNPFGG